MRKPIIVGNWKMYNNIRESIKLIEDIKKYKFNMGVEVVVAVPFTSLNETKKAIIGTDIKLAAQNMHWEDNGAFTGEISPLMVKEIGIEYCIIGHSERRRYFNETDIMVNKKTKAALKHGIKPIACVGETLKERNDDKAQLVVRTQVLKALDGIKKDDVKDIVIAYEPVWAIGTGKTASLKDADSMCGCIRKIVEDKYGKETSKVLRIQYGGSVKPNTIKELMSGNNIDGALVGGASLIAEDFIKLVNY